MAKKLHATGNAFRKTVKDIDDTRKAKAAVLRQQRQEKRGAKEQDQITALKGQLSKFFNQFAQKLPEELEKKLEAIRNAKKTTGSHAISDTLTLDGGRINAIVSGSGWDKDLGAMPGDMKKTLDTTNKINAYLQKIELKELAGFKALDNVCRELDVALDCQVDMIQKGELRWCNDGWQQVEYRAEITARAEPSKEYREPQEPKREYKCVR